MPNQSFISKSYYRLYDAIVPLFRLVYVVLMLFVMVYRDELRPHPGSLGFFALYLGYATALLVFKKVRAYLVLRHPFLIGSFETVLLTIGVGYTGGSHGPFHLTYLLVIAFFAIVHGLKASLLMGGLCAVCYAGMVLVLGEGLTYHVVIELIFLFSFAIFIGSINQRISQYTMKMAIYDQLTSLYNRQYFYGELQNKLAFAEKNQRNLSLIVLDVNDFKQMNDRHGHLQGDRILVQVGAVIRGQARAGDIAARYGGDEFVILMPNTDKAKARQLCNQLQALIRESSAGVTVSAGFATYPNDGVAPDSLFHAADMVMYREKQAKGQMACPPTD